MSRLAQVIDLNKCIGCQTCTVACKRLWTDREGTAQMWWNIVNTLPGEGTPRGWQTMGGGFVAGELVLGELPSAEAFGLAWDYDWEALERAGGPGQRPLRPLGETPTWGPNWEEDRGGGTFPNAYAFYLPRLCNHCSRPACVESCPVQAIVQQDDGTVVLQEDKCQGMQLCARACPYKRIYFDTVAVGSKKCIGCFPRIERGVAPACVRQCPGRARHFGDLDDPASQVHRLVREWAVALPLHADFGTEPNVYYVPPMLPAPLAADGTVDLEGTRLPEDLLRGLFGPGVRAALDRLRAERERRRRGEPSELMDLLISRRWHDMLGGWDAAPNARN